MNHFYQNNFGVIRSHYFVLYTVSSSRCSGRRGGFQDPGAGVPDPEREFPFSLSDFKVSRFYQTNDDQTLLGAEHVSLKENGQIFTRIRQIGACPLPLP